MFLNIRFWQMTTERQMASNKKNEWLESFKKKTLKSLEAFI